MAGEGIREAADKGQNPWPEVISSSRAEICSPIKIFTAYGMILGGPTFCRTGIPLVSDSHRLADRLIAGHYDIFYDTET